MIHSGMKGSKGRVAHCDKGRMWLWLASTDRKIFPHFSHLRLLSVATQTVIAFQNKRDAHCFAAKAIVYDTIHTIP